MGPIRIAYAATVAAMLTSCARTDSTADTSAVTAGGDSAAAMNQMSADTVATAASSGLATSSGKPGKYLTDANGRTVYIFVKDQKNVSSCTDACAAAWPPFSGTATSTDSAVKSAMIGTITRTDGRSQTTYNGMPLYHYEDDKKAGDITGQGKNEFGGLWYVVSPRGQRIVGSR